jgi:hypothetical protein
MMVWGARCEVVGAVQSAGCGVLCLVLSAPIAAQERSLDAVMVRAAVYVEDFERRLSGIVAEEDYTQQVRPDKAGLGFVSELKRDLRSDVLWLKPNGARDWLMFRDVFDVDGVPVRDRTDRLLTLFINPARSADAQVKDIIAESARYNIGSVMRTINAPLLPLLFLESKNHTRFTFSRAQDASPSAMTAEAPAPPGHFRVSTELWAIEFREREHGTMIRTTTMRDLPARGRFWIDPITGRVMMSELILEARDVRGSVTVQYQDAPSLGLLVPAEMRERYDKLRDKSIIEGFASYSHFRPFAATVDGAFPIRRQ